MSNWYYVIGDDQHGPVGDEDIQHMLASGELQPDDLVWQAGMADWIAVSQAFPAAGNAPGIAGESVQSEDTYPPYQEEAGAAPVMGDVFDDSAGQQEIPAEPYVPVREGEVRQMPGAPPAVSGEQQIHPLAIASVVMAAAGFFVCALTALPAIVAGHMALSQINCEPQRYGGKPLAIAGLVVGYALFIPFILLCALFVIGLFTS